LLALALGCASPAGQVEPQAPHYSLSVRVLPAERRLEVSGTVRIPASNIPREDLRLALAARVSELQASIIEPAGSAGPAPVERVSDPADRVEGERGNATWVVRPGRAIPAETPVTLRFSYVADGKAAFISYVGPEVAFATGWGDYWYPVVEGIGGMGTGELTVEAPSGWKVFTDPPQQKPTHFTFAAGPYTVVERAGPVPLKAWLLSPRAHIDGYLAGVSTMMDTLSAEFGPYPFAELTLIEVPRSIAKKAGFNAFSPAGFLVLNSRAFDVPEVKYLLEWLGHELSHQWFPHAVIWDPPGFLYMEEALAEYGGMRVVEEIAGPEAARRLRTSGYEYDPIYSAEAYFRQVGSGEDQPLAEMKSGIAQRNLAYNKGALMFDMLSREVGRAKFREILHGITRDRRLDVITWRQFRDAVASGTGRDLDWFFAQWLDRAGAPDFQLSWQPEGDAVRGTITQSAPYYRAHLTIQVRGPGGERDTRVVEIAGASVDFSIAPGFSAAEVLLDPDYEVLRWTPEYRAIAEGAQAARTPSR